MTCSVSGCGRLTEAHGLCHTHYARAWERGEMPARPTVEERFWAKVDKTGECWLWTAHCGAGGYGRFALTHRKTVKAHRWSYEAMVGPIPEGLTLDHLCRIRACVNPDHLEPVTMRENLLRGETFQAANAAKTHCPQGHPYDDENTRVYNGRRHCRACTSNGSKGRCAA